MMEPLTELSDDEFFAFCASNSDYRIERTAEGRIVVMLGAGGETGSQNIELSMQLQIFAKADRGGVAFDSSTLFRLPSSAMRSPDAAWVERIRLVDLTASQKQKFLPLCPDFVVELTSPSDRLSAVRDKMTEWMSSGCQLGWIIHPAKRQVHIYRASGVEVLQDVAEIEGEGVVAGFTLDLRPIWDPGW